MFIIHAFHQLLQPFLMYCERCRHHQHALSVTLRHRRFYRRLNPYNGKIPVFAAHLLRRHRRRRIARYHHRLALFRKHKTNDFIHVGDYLLSALGPIRDMICVRIKDKIFLRHHYQRLMQQRHAANP